MLTSIQDLDQKKKKDLLMEITRGKTDIMKYELKVFKSLFFFLTQKTRQQQQQNIQVTLNQTQICLIQ